MKRYAIQIVSLISLTFLEACITPYDPDLRNDNPKLVVEGLITDEPGPYVVKLTLSAAYNNDESIFGRYPEGARVFISDDMGQEEELEYTRAGVYVTSETGIRGQAGRSYVLRILLSDGRTYESRPELLTQVPPIDSLYSEYERFDEGFLRGEFSVFIDTSDPADETNFYKWDYTHYEYKEFCQEVLNRDGSVFSVPCCGDCWAKSSCSSCFNLSNDVLVDGRKIARNLILKIPYDSRDPYFVLIRQFSLTQEAYDFWKVANQVVNNSGGVFDKPPVPVKGNIYNVQDPEEQVLGYFGASSVYLLPALIRRDNIEEGPFGTLYPRAIQTYCLECEESATRTSVKPSGWDDAELY